VGGEREQPYERQRLPEMRPQSTTPRRRDRTL